MMQLVQLFFTYSSSDYKETNQKTVNKEDQVFCRRYKTIGYEVVKFVKVVGKKATILIH